MLFLGERTSFTCIRQMIDMQNRREKSRGGEYTEACVSGDGSIDLHGFCVHESIEPCESDPALVLRGSLVGVNLYSEVVDHPANLRIILPEKLYGVVSEIEIPMYLFEAVELLERGSTQRRKKIALKLIGELILQYGVHQTELFEGAVAKSGAFGPELHLIKKDGISDAEGFGQTINPISRGGQREFFAHMLDRFPAYFGQHLISPVSLFFSRTG